MKKKMTLGIVILAAAILIGVLAWPRLFPEKGTFEELVLAKCGISGEDITKIFTGYGHYESNTIEDPAQIDILIEYFSRGTYTYAGKNPYKDGYNIPTKYFQVRAEDKSIYIYFHILPSDQGNMLMLTWQGRTVGSAIYRPDFAISMRGIMDALGL